MKKIWRVVVIVYGLLNIELLAEENKILLSNGYSFIKTTKINKYDELIERIDILKNNKSVLYKENNHVSVGDDIFTNNYISFDINRDGIKEILFSSKSGGTHCCYETEILSLDKNGLKSLLRVNLKNYSLIKIKDLNNDNIDEVLVYDDSYSYVGDFSFIDSPSIEIIFEFKNGKYLFSERLMRIKKIDKNQTHRSGIQVFLDYLYRGEYKKGIHLVSKESSPTEYGVFTVEEWFVGNFKKTIERATQSIYWSNIKNMNGWSKFNDTEIKKILVDEVKREFPIYANIMEE